MKIVFFGNGNRGTSCLQALLDKGYEVPLVVGHPGEDNPVVDLAKQKDIKTIIPEDPNDEKTLELLRSLNGDLFVLAGYGKIFRQTIIDIPKIMCINLHAGKLPEYRGSSPMNWVLINGEKSFGLSIIQLDARVDAGDILDSRNFDVSENDTIENLHSIANEQFPLMLIDVIEQIKEETHWLTPQDDIEARYYPLRSPDDGLIVWDMYTAEEIHNRIRALTEPYPCAFTFFNGKRVRLLSSILDELSYFGEPGKIYKKTKKGLFICAKDECLWITNAVFDDGSALIDKVDRYDRLATVKWSALENNGINLGKRHKREK